MKTTHVALDAVSDRIGWKDPVLKHPHECGMRRRPADSEQRLI
jgi:hypothetical protein